MKILLKCCALTCIALFTSLAFAQTDCGMPERIKAMRQMSLIGEKSQRPEAIGFIESTSLPIRLHYQEGVTLEYSSKILEYAETSWTKMFDEVGFLKPHPDGEIGGGTDIFDIYIITDMIEGVGGYAGFSGYYEETPRQDAYGYLVIANEVTPLLIRGVVAHELNHVSQMAYDWWEDISFMEGTATWSSDLVFPEENMIWRYFTFYNSQPWIVLDFISLKNPYQYGTGMWVMYLDEHFGNNDGKFIRDIWAGLVQDSYENEPDYLDVTGSMLASKGTTFDQSFRNFGAWRVFLGSRNDANYFAKSENWTGWSRSIEPYFEAEASPSMNLVEGSAVHPVEQYSHVFFSFPRKEGETGTYSFNFKAQSPDRYTVDAYLRVDDVWQIVASGIAEGVAPEVSLNFTTESKTGEIVIIVANITDGNYDADTSSWQGREFDYRFEHVPSM